MNQINATSMGGAVFFLLFLLSPTLLMKNSIYKFIYVTVVLFLAWKFWKMAVNLEFEKTKTTQLQ